MGKHDGVFRKESFDEHYTTLLKEMGILDADIKTLTSLKNITTWTVMETADHVITSWLEHSAAPHLNFRVTGKIGEIVTVKNPLHCTTMWNKRTDDELVRRMEINGKVIISHLTMNSFGFDIHTTMDGSTLHCKDVFRKLSPDINGYYKMEKEEHLLLLLKQMLPGFTAKKWEELKIKGIDMRFREVKDLTDETKDVIIWEVCYDNKMRTIFKMDESVEYINRELGIKDTRMMTKVCPGRYKMICKDHMMGMVTEHEFNFTDYGITVTSVCAGIKATAIYKRCPDIEGRWRVVTKEGESGFLDACGELEPMKSEIMASKDIHEIMRLGWGKLWHKTNSKFFPGEMTTKMGEQWEAELPDLGKVQGITTELYNTMIICMKKDKTVTIKHKVSGDFIVSEYDVDGLPATRMKQVMVREAERIHEEHLAHRIKHMHV